MRAPSAPSTPQLRLHPDAAAVEVQALYRGIVIDSRCLTGDDEAYLIGSAKGVDAPAAERLAGPAHPLVSADGRGFTVDLTGEMTGTVIFEDRSASLAELLRVEPQFVPPPAARLQIACGDVAFLIGTTAPAATVPRPPVARWRDHWALAIAGAAALLLMLLVSFVPPDQMALSGDNLGKYTRTITATTIPPEPPLLPSAAGGVRGGGAHGGDGKPAAPNGHRRGPSDRRPIPPRHSNPADVGTRGILALIESSPGKAWDSVFQPDQALERGGFNDLITDGGPGGHGPGGLDPVGTGAGPGHGPLAGSGPLGIIGCDAACRSRIALADHGPGGLGPRKVREVQVISEPGHVRGSLNKDIVRRIIRAHLNEVKYCYEQQLPRHPDLAGRLAVQFTIAPTGAVLASLLQSSTMGNLAVEQCVVQAVKRWEFPKPEGGGMVVVSYPFVLVPAGAS